MEYTMTLNRSKLAAEGLMWTGVGACITGLLLHRMWTVLPAGRFSEMLRLAALDSAELSPAQRAGVQAEDARRMLSVGEAEWWQRTTGRAP